MVGRSDVEGDVIVDEIRVPLWLVGGGSEIAITTFTERIRHLRSVAGGLYGWWVVEAK